MSDYDIILINPDALLGNRLLVANVGLASLEATLLRANIRCRTIHISETEQYLDQAEVFGVSVMDHTYAAARLITQRLAHKTVIWGGWTATALPEYILQENPGVDYVVLREGELRLPALLRALEQPAQLAQLDGIAYRDANGAIIVRPPNGYVNLDDLPIPTKLAVLNELVFVEVARGCYGGCGYCQETYRMRFKSAANAATEIQHWYDQGFRYIYLGDANSIANGKLLAALVREVEARALEIQVFLTGRPGDILRNLPVLEAMFTSRFMRVHSIEMGVEANSQHALDLLHRRSTPDLNRRALAALLALRDRHSPQTKVHANMILFSHFEMTLADFIANTQFIGEFECSREVLALQLYGVANTPLWFEMRARGFPMQPERGLQIADYPFSDPDVERLFAKLVRVPLAALKQKKNFSYFDQVDFQHHVYDRLLEFYRAPDIRARVLEFSHTAEASGA